ncbi:MaoC family dehydratase N-terminal domain-containing protein [Paenibacillus endoradicis]|uniref:MaoC family dehydratase N-terminal domain-containing protein n=1 Tax=Paenibacillus endoradicis TaxID=2972487 RepID=UPI0021590BD1|nr:MaoC family dehydratase N-terminal domain-containing protein [Paenibacillus endoradicis]MCR8656464.1 MaoC family dehydratase N-terminal domain-containing protein [Paenibacillus endoradicis]
MTSVQFRLQITEDWISRYAQSIDSPLQTINNQLIAPATMPIIFWRAFEIPWLEINMSAPLIHGMQSFIYESPIIAGMNLDCELQLTNIVKKTSRNGSLTLYYHKLICKCDGAMIVTAETVLIRVGDQDEETNNK